MKLNREKAIKIMSLIDELKAELVGTYISVEGELTVAVEVNKMKENIEFEGAKYRKVDRKVREGDVVIYHDRHESTLPNKPYKAVLVDGLVCYKNESGSYKYSCHGWGGKSQHNTYELIQEVNTVNQQRAEIIKKAKSFVLEHFNHPFNSTEPNNKIAKDYWYETEFINKKNRITALVYPINGFEERISSPVAIGRSICKDGDVFNKHIGEAIALGRALELDVNEFENAVQPSEVVVGHIINTKQYGLKRVVLTDKEVNTEKDTCALHSLMVKHYLKSIINDTNAQYEVIRSWKE